MWAEPDGVRVLYAPDEAVGRFVTSVYRFDRLEIVPMESWSDGRRLVLRFGERPDVRELRFEARHGVPLPVLTTGLTRWVEGPIARVTMKGVRTFGTSPTGVSEWYRAARWAPLRTAAASVGGRDLGRWGPVAPATRFGFSEPPHRPAMVQVRPVLADPTGRLDQVIDGLLPPSS